MIVTRDELEALIKSEGCTFIPRRRRKGKIYFYASRRWGSDLKEVYIAPESKINNITREQVLEKLGPIKK